MVETTNMYWEDYDSQSSADFTHVGYQAYNGEFKLVPVEENLARQVAEILRCNGSETCVRVYREN